MEPENRNNMCPMCYFVNDSSELLIKHVIQNHRLDPTFKVYCTENGCGASYRNWKSFRQHIYNKHRNLGNLDKNMDVDIDCDFNNGAPPIPDIHPDDFQDNEINDNEDYSIKSMIWQAAKFLIHLRENCKVSQIAINYIIDGLSTLINFYSSLILRSCRQEMDNESNKIDVAFIEELLKNDLSPSNIFSTINSKKLLDKFLIEELNIMEATEIKISSQLEWKKKKKINRKGEHDRVLKTISHAAYVVPFMSNLKNLLENHSVRNQVDNPPFHQPGIYKTILDGSYYRETSIFADNQNALAIILYYDDLNVTSLLGNSSKKQKLSMFYWALGNIKPEMRSSKNAIQLLAICKYSYLKEPDGLKILLQPFINDIIKLQTDGINIYVDRELKNYKGSLLNFLGDTPASAFIGGFKESVAAHRPCRTCLVTKDDLKVFTKDSDCKLRNIVDHHNHLDAISEPNLSKASVDFWKLFYGIIRL